MPYTFSEEERAKARQEQGSQAALERIKALQAKYEADETPAAADTAAAPAAPVKRELSTMRFNLAIGAIAVLVAIVVIRVVNGVLAPHQDAPATLSNVATAHVPAPSVVPTATAPPPPLMIIAWAAPDGQVLGPIPLPTTAAARYDDRWIGVTWQGAIVWVRASDAPQLMRETLPNLRPPTPAPAPPPPAVQQQQAPAPAVEPAAENEMPDTRQLRAAPSAPSQRFREDDPTAVPVATTT